VGKHFQVLEVYWTLEKTGIEIKNEEKISLCPKYVEKIAKEALVSQAWPQKEAEAVGASAEVPNDLMEIQARDYESEDCYLEPISEIFMKKYWELGELKKSQFFWVSHFNLFLLHSNEN
jgi:hypothetical protein